MINTMGITGIILAGGKSSRMGIDKGFLKLNDKLFAQCCIDALKPLVEDILIIADDKKYDSFGYQRLEDDIKNAGPVSGIYTGLKSSKTEWNIILSCDIPNISTNVLDLLIDEIDDTSEIIQIESNGKSMPLVALYKKSVANKFHNLLRGNERRLRIAVSECNFKNVQLEANLQYAVMNVNTKEEFKNLEHADQG